MPSTAYLSRRSGQPELAPAPAIDDEAGSAWKTSSTAAAPSLFALAKALSG
jgi:hypothetical protein